MQTSTSGPLHDAGPPSTELATLAEDVAGVGYWQLDVATQKIHWSTGVFRLYGLPFAGEPDLEAAMACVHPDDFQSATALLDAAMREGRSYSNQVRLKRADGSWRTVKGQAVCQRNDAGEVVTVIGALLDVTDTEKVSETLHRTESRYRLLVENVTEIIAEITPAGTITFITPSCRAILGYEPDELIGHRSLEFTHPSDIADAIETYTKLVAAGPEAAPVTIEHRSLHKDGRWVWLEGQPKVIFDPVTRQPIAIQDVLRDVTARRAIKDRLRQSEERYRQLAEKSRDVIVRADAQGIVLYVSPGCRALGYEPEELIGKSGVSLLHPDDMKSFIANHEELMSGAPFDQSRPREHRFRCKNGEWIWLQGNPTVIRDERGKPCELLNVFRDISERRKIDAALIEAREAAESAAAAKAEFLANMSHELRTPLTSVIGFSELLKEQPELSAQSTRFVNRVLSASRALLSVVNDVLDFSKLEAGQIEIKRAPASPRTIAAEAIELFAPQAEEKSIDLSCDVQEDLPESLDVDAGRLRQILLNIVGNAVKFTERGSVALKVAFDDGRLKFEVRDTGPGIANDKLHRLFQRFSQIDGSSHRMHGGSGLGLAICKGLVDAMDGTIGVTSKVKSGSAFSFEIPASLGVCVEGPGADVQVRSADVRGLRILIADDHSANRLLIRAILEPVGALPVLAASGREAIDQAAANPFDLILMDLLMPDMNGREAAWTIRRSGGPNARTPILAFTADAIRDAASELSDGPFDGVVLKPLTRENLFKSIDAATRPAEFGASSIKVRHVRSV